jgi:peptide-methionine (R)-S-oxide reductase
MRSNDPDRRRFLGVFAATAVASISLPFILRGMRPAMAADAPRPAKTGNVTLDEFGANKKLIDTRSLPRVVMTEEQWKEKLSSKSYYVTREAGTEAPGSGGMVYETRDNGLYRCICCDTALYDSATKFESGTGWPSFYQPISKRNLASATDRSLIEERTEVKCARCDVHLGHVFDDGPDPTGLRYCMNAVAMRFVPFAA